MENLIQALTHIPWWVYLLILYVAKVGLQATRPSIVPVKKLVIAPLIFAYLSIHSLMLLPNISMIQVGVWSGAIVAGLLGGWWLVSRLTLAFDKNRMLVQLPGTWSTLLVMLCVFLSKFYMGYEAAQGGQMGLNLIALTVSGFSTGVICGRVLGYFYRFTSSSSVNLEG
ncbi:MAG TPA: hypothetical protein VN611_03135 [Patescibacteria group bacterium]|nr:hypothetical protein [Patescibacteria group bacterium]